MSDLYHVNPPPTLTPELPNEAHVRAVIREELTAFEARVRLLIAEELAKHEQAMIERAKRR